MKEIRKREYRKNEPPVSPPVNPRLVLAEICRTPQITYDELALAINKHRNTIRGYMKWLRTEFHRIERGGSDKNGYWRIFNRRG